ncbi:hypothetical protein AOL_s00054g939 [Orbilia oligospora ATCC 24927]|uniref:Uncharacterized protein n=1 Tax=Arthrobotrys oligospora (strain ATCC 24927 / CBS 115.81 / DSM 1491) TaxID=756982 RepID=G1X7M2_ARTOA|nr:hypothetical protein AOL_s00054g939 [Orbilia oligospora ATCC 24927]EGX50853.1 hypothetical protein AOL_s00054g939 [Orbilia oligospora ATCC 24927]
MPPVTPSVIYALSRVLPYTQTSLKPRDSEPSDDDDKGTLKIEPDAFLKALSLLLVEWPTNEITAVVMIRDLPHTTVLFAGSKPFSTSERNNFEMVQHFLGSPEVVKSASFLFLAMQHCHARIISRAARLGGVGNALGITLDTADRDSMWTPDRDFMTTVPDRDFTMICVPDEETVWKYILSQYGTKGLEKSSLRREIQLLFLNAPRLDSYRHLIEDYLRMAMLLSEVLTNGLELWSTGAIAGLPLSNEDGGKCGVFLAKKEFGMSGAELEKVYEESEVLMCKVVDAVRDVGAYAKGAEDIMAFINANPEFRKSLRERETFFYEVPPKIPLIPVEIIGKPVNLINKFLRKSGRAAITDARIMKAFPNLPESRLGSTSQTVACNAHCGIHLILSAIRRGYSRHPSHKINISYGFSENSCYLCETYIEVLKRHLVGEELKKFLAPPEKTETRRQQHDEDSDDLSMIMSHLKGLTVQPGKTLRGWFSGVAQLAPGVKSSNSDPPRELELSEESTRQQDLEQEEKLENPGYSRGYREICGEWRFPKGTPGVVVREVEKVIEERLRYIYSTTRASEKKSEDLKAPEDLPPTIMEARNNL